MNREGIKKHKAVFDAWLEGAYVETRMSDQFPWVFVGSPEFRADCEYRVVVRDWAWACQQMLDGRKVIRSGIGMYLSPSGGPILVRNSRGDHFRPAVITVEDLRATDWRIAD